MPLRFDLSDLRLFLHVVDEASISAGARASGIGLAAASARVLALEDSLQQPLLVRTARGVPGAAAGQARAVLQQMNRLRSALGAQVPGLRRKLHLPCSSAAWHGRLPDLLGDFLAQDAALNLTLQELPDAQAVAAVADGRAELAIVGAQAELYGMPAFDFPPDPLVLVMAPTHPLAQAAAGGPVPLALADGCDVVALPEGTALQDHWDRQAALRGAALNHRIRVDSCGSQCRLVAAGVGLALMPRDTARRQARQWPLVLVALTDPLADQPLRVCVRQPDGLSHDARRLLAALRALPADLAAQADLANRAGTVPWAAPDSPAEAG
jgi:DNA-binding transcriptional LysR family regulator